MQSNFTKTLSTKTANKRNNPFEGVNTSDKPTHHKDKAFKRTRNAARRNKALSRGLYS